MNLTKKDIAEGLGMTYDGVLEDYEGCLYHTFWFRDNNKVILEPDFKTVDEAWESASDKPLEDILFKF